MSIENKQAFFQQELKTKEVLKTHQDGEVLVLEIAPERVARVVDIYTLGHTDITPDQASAQMRAGAEEMRYIAEEYGIDTVYKAHRVDTVANEDGDQLNVLFTVTDRVHGRLLTDPSLPDEVKQEGMIRTLQYYGDRLYEDGEIMLSDIVPKNVMWGHTAEDPTDRYIFFDTDPLIDEDPGSKAGTVQTTIVDSWKEYATDNNLSTDEIEFVEAEARKQSRKAMSEGLRELIDTN